MEGLDCEGMYSGISLADRATDTRSPDEMARPMLFVLGIFWVELNGGVLVSATAERVPMKSREKASYLELTIMD